MPRLPKRRQRAAGRVSLILASWWPLQQLSQQGRQCRDVKWFLHYGRASFLELRDLRGIEKSPGHKHESWPRPLRVRAYTIEKLLSVQSRQIKIAKNEFVLMGGKVQQCFFGAGRSFHNHSARSQAFMHDLANAFFVVHNKNGVAAQFG